MNKDQQLLAEAYKQVQVNESMIGNVLNWIGQTTGANVELLRTLYVKELIDFLAGLGFSALYIVVALLVFLAFKAPQWTRDVIDALKRSARGKRIAVIVDKLKDDDEARTIVSTLQSWKEDQSKEGVLRRKAAAERLKEMIKAAGDTENEETIEGAFDTLKYS